MAHMIRQNQEHLEPFPEERRIQLRYRMSARAVFSWEGPDRERFEGEGVTRDISYSGAFIVTTSCPPAGAAVKVELFLPPLHGTVATARIGAEALVLRVERTPAGEDENGFAVDTAGFSFSSGAKLDSESGSNLTHRGIGESPDER